MSFKFYFYNPVLRYSYTFNNIFMSMNVIFRFNTVYIFIIIILFKRNKR